MCSTPAAPASSRNAPICDASAYRNTEVTESRAAGKVAESSSAHFTASTPAGRLSLPGLRRLAAGGYGAGSSTSGRSFRSSRQSFDRSSFPGGYSKSHSPTSEKPTFLHTAFDGPLATDGNACR